MKASSPRVVSGRVLSVGQKEIVTSGVDTTGYPTTYKSQGIALRLDSVELPLRLNTPDTDEIFVAEGDMLEIACLAHADRLEIYGIRNQTDGSIYLARTALVASAHLERMILGGALGVSAVAAGIAYLCEADRDIYECIFWILLAFPAALCIGGAICRLFGFAVMPDARGHAQPGGRREMNAARQALAISREERPRIRFM